MPVLGCLADGDCFDPSGTTVAKVRASPTKDTVDPSFDSLYMMIEVGSLGRRGFANRYTPHAPQYWIVSLTLE